jgi:hypothetical protein
LVLSPLAWLKLMLFLHGGDTEVGGFGVSREDDLLYLEEFAAVRQRVTAATVAFDDAAVADYFDERVDAGLPPARFGRVWVHTHPGDSPDPSLTDEETFARAFGGCDWAVMLIVSRTGRTYCRLSLSAGPGASLLLPVRVDWAAWPDLLLDRAGELGTVFENWMDEYGRNVEPVFPQPPRSGRRDRPWTNDLWQEDKLYGSTDLLAAGDDEFAPHERRHLDDRFAAFFEAVGEVAP